MTEVRTPNLPELKRLNMWVQEQDKLEPGARIWEQGDWVKAREESPMCQSAYCVCGMAIVRAGHTLSTGPARPGSGNALLGVPDIFLDGRRIDETPIGEFGAELLGLDAMTGHRLFRGSNEATNIDRIIREIFADAGVDYDSVEPAPDLEIEIKAAEVANAAEAVRPQLLPTITV